MSNQQTLEQKRAAFAWEKIKFVQKESYKKEYGQLARSAPALIQVNGLGQAMAFLRAKGPKDSKKGNNAHGKLYGDISEWMKLSRGYSHPDGLSGWIVNASTTSDQYRCATSDVIALLVWIKRFAEAELGGEK
jgi:CRISPR-associated protein Cmr5